MKQYDFRTLLEAPLAWHETEDPDRPWAARLHGRKLSLLLNEYPGDPLYSLEVERRVVGMLDDWPEIWTRDW